MEEGTQVELVHTIRWSFRRSPRPETRSNASRNWCLRIITRRRVSISRSDKRAIHKQSCTTCARVCSISSEPRSVRRATRLEVTCRRGSSRSWGNVKRAMRSAGRGHFPVDLSTTASTWREGNASRRAWPLLARARGTGMVPRESSENEISRRYTPPVIDHVGILAVSDLTSTWLSREVASQAAPTRREKYILVFGIYLGSPVLQVVGKLAHS